MPWCRRTSPTVSSVRVCAAMWGRGREEEEERSVRRDPALYETDRLCGEYICRVVSVVPRVMNEVTILIEGVSEILSGVIDRSGPLIPARGVRRWDRPPLGSR